MKKVLFLLAGVLAVNTATASKMASLIIAAYNAGTLTLRGAASLIAGTGVVGFAVALAALGAWFVLKNKIKKGHGALTAW